MVALSVAAVLAVFLLYTSLAGGGTPRSSRASCSGHSEHRRRSADASSAPDRAATAARRALPPPRPSRARRPSASSTRARSPISSRPAATSYVEGQLGQRRLRRRAGHAGHQVPVEVRRPRRAPPDPWLSSVAPPSSSASASSLYALAAGALRRADAAPRLAVSAQNALVAAFGATLVAGDRPARRARPPRLLVRLRRASTRAASCRSATRSPRSGAGRRLAAPLAARPDRLLGGRRLHVPPRRTPTCSPWVVPVLGARRDVLRVPARRRRKPVRDAGRAGEGRRPEPEPAEPVHGRAPAAAVPRLRRADGAVGVRDGGAALATDRRALDRRDAALDARRLDVLGVGQLLGAQVGVRGGRVGRLLRLGSRSRTPR